MRIIKLAVAVSAMICVAATSLVARESGAHKSGSASKSGTSKHGKSAHSTKAKAKRKSAGKTARLKRETEKSGSQLRGTGDIDVSGTVWDLPPEDLPVNDPDETDDDATP